MLNYLYASQEVQCILFYFYILNILMYWYTLWSSGVVKLFWQTLKDKVCLWHVLGKLECCIFFVFTFFFPKDKVTSNKSVASINYYRTQKQQISLVGTVRLNRNKEERISSPFHCRGSHLLVTLKNRPDKNIWFL